MPATAAAGATSATLIPQTTNAPPAVPIRHHGVWPPHLTGPTHDVVPGENGLAYVFLTGAGLLVMDLTDMANPVVLGTLPMGGNGPMVRSGNWLLLGTDGLQVIDISNPAKPVRVTHLLEGYITELLEKDGQVYVTTATSHAMVQVEDRRTPEVIWNIPLPHGSDSISVDGGRLYVLDGIYVRIYDLKTPELPVLVGWFPHAVQTPKTLTVRDGIAYILNDDGILSADLRDPTNGLTLDLQLYPFPFLLKPSIALRGRYAYITHDATIHVVDILDPRHMLFVREVKLPQADNSLLSDFQAGMRGIHLIGDTMLVARDYDGFELLSLADPLNPTPLAQIHTYSDIQDVKVSGNDLYLLRAPYGVQRVDFSDPEHPKVLGSYPLRLRRGDWVQMQVNGSYVYIYQVGRDLLVLDFSNPAAPRALTEPTVRELNTGAAMFMGDGRLIGCSYSEELSLYRMQLLDLTRPEAPAAVWNSLRPGFKQPGFCAPRSVLFSFSAGPLWSIDSTNLLRFDHQLSVFDTRSNPWTQTPRAEIPLGACHNYMVTDRERGRAWLGGEDVQGVDIQNPSRPADLGVFHRGHVAGMTLSGGRLFFTTPEGLKVMDVSDGRRGAVLGSYDIPRTEAVAVVGKLAMVARRTEGLLQLDLGETPLSPPRILRQPVSVSLTSQTSARFEVVAEGSFPLVYQWRRGGVPLPGATNSLLLVTNLDRGHLTELEVIVTNIAGTASSTRVTLRASPPPGLHLTTPTFAQFFRLNQPIPLVASVTSGEAELVSVEFFVDDIRVALVEVRGTGALPPVQAIWSTDVEGEHRVHAVARDANLLRTESESVPLFINTVRSFQFTTTRIDILESNGPVRVGIRRNFDGPASVGLATYPISAQPVETPFGLGQYAAAQQEIRFEPGELEREAEVAIFDNQVLQGDTSFGLVLTTTTPGTFTSVPDKVVVHLIDDDQEWALPDEETQVASPRAALSGRGTLKVNLDPPEAGGRWRFPWETRWRESGETAAGLVPGEYPTRFLPRTGFRSPDPATNTVAAGATETQHETYLAVTLQTGGLGLVLQPESARTGAVHAQWRLQGSTGSVWHDSGILESNLPAGLHLVEFREVPGYVAPASQVFTVTAGRSVVQRATYSLVTPESGLPLEPVRDFQAFTPEPGLVPPLAFTGQLLSEAGYGSGWVVKPRTVLTAAHAVFNTEKLSFAGTVWWFFQRHRDEHEPIPLVPRGAYLYSGYAAARQADIQNGTTLQSESSAATLGLDVATLYFFEDAGRGGFGGYLVSRPGTNQLETALPTVAMSYPVQGIAETNRGLLHVAGPGRFDFTFLDGRLGFSSLLRSHPGSSGGPVCVSHLTPGGDSRYFPAAIQLGGAGRTVVRLIDVDVQDMIRRAERSSLGGPATTGGGFISFEAAQAGGTHRAGLVSIRLGPPAALRSGGSWRVSPTNHGESGELSRFTNYTAAVQTLAVISTNFGLEIRPLHGFTAPPNQQAQLVEDANLLLDLRYEVIPPRWVFDAGLGWGLVGTPGTAYRVETRRKALESSPWTELLQLSLEPGTNWLSGGIAPGTAAAIALSGADGGASAPVTNWVRRAVWLSE